MNITKATEAADAVTAMILDQIHLPKIVALLAATHGNEELVKALVKAKVLVQPAVQWDEGDDDSTLWWDGEPHVGEDEVQWCLSGEVAASMTELYRVVPS